MAVCKTISPHLALEAATTIEGSTFTGAKPASRLLTPHLWDAAESDGSSSQYVTFDLGSARAVEACAVLGHTIPAAPGVLRVAGDNDNASWGAPMTGWIDLTWDADGIIEFFAATHTWQYWRVEISASAAFEIGSIVLGEVWEAPHAGYDGLRRRTRHSRDGTQTFRSVGFGFSNLTQAQSAALYAIVERHLQGQAYGPNHYGAVPALVCLDSGGDIVAGGLQDWSVYGVFAGELGPDMGYHTREGYQLTLEECL